MIFLWANNSQIYFVSQGLLTVGKTGIVAVVVASLPTIGESPSTWPTKLNAYIAALTARVMALGGDPMTLPLPTVGDSEDAWGAILNDYLTELDSRVVTVESGSVGVGYDLGLYGDTYGSGTIVNSGAYELTAHSYFKKPNYAVVGWGGLFNENLDAVESMINKIIALEAAEE